MAKQVWVELPDGSFGFYFEPQFFQDQDRLVHVDWTIQDEDSGFGYSLDDLKPLPEHIAAYLQRRYDFWYQLIALAADVQDSAIEAAYKVADGLEKRFYD